eukprot:scaffold118936_cov28-Tisochrysis_lutea.AAC.6
MEALQVTPCSNIKTSKMAPPTLAPICDIEDDVLLNRGWCGGVRVRGSKLHSARAYERETRTDSPSTSQARGRCAEIGFKTDAVIEGEQLCPPV